VPRANDGNIVVEAACHGKVLRVPLL
jgi:hypothetical protein